MPVRRPHTATYAHGGGAELKLWISAHNGDSMAQLLAEIADVPMRLPKSTVKNTWEKQR